MEDKQIKCNKCNSINLHWLVWVDTNNKIVAESGQSENGEYWCDDCNKHKGE